MHTIGKSLLALSVAMAGAPAALAHHSAAAFNTQESVTITGTVSEYSFRNPHVYMTLEVTRPDGSSHELEVEAGAASVLNPLGFTRDSVAVGDIVRVSGNPGRRDPEGLMLGRELYKDDGSYFPLNISSRSIYEDSEAAAGSIAGTWFPPRTSFFSYLGDGANWSLTEAGQAASSNVDPRATTQKDCIPIAAPGLMVYPVANTVSVEGDRVVMDIDWLDSERVIWLDGREHPPASETFLHGYSVGRWDGDALEVDTRNYSEHEMGLSMAVPGSTRKRLRERFELSEDGKKLIYSVILEDPVYLAAPVEWSGEWLYRPQMSHSNERCDLEVARRFLDD